MDFLGLSSGELIVHAVEGAAWVGAALVGLKIKDLGNRFLLSQTKMEQRLTENHTQMEMRITAKQNDLRADFDRKHAENAQKIAVHETRDEERFESLDKASERVEQKLDRVEQKLDRYNGAGK